MRERPYDALIVDLDGTLLTSGEEVHPATRRALVAARAAGVRVMVVTGRSLIATRPILKDLELEGRSVIFNGAAVYCSEQDRLVEERTLSERALDRLHSYGARTGDMTLLMSADHKLALRPRSERESRSLEGLNGVRFVERDELRAEHVIRATFISDRHDSSAALAAELEAAVKLPLYVTHFPLSVLPRHRASSMHAVDVQPPCRGKAEALRVLEETYGIAPARVVAVGDATNDGPMVQRAGLGVAMGNAMPELKRVAARVIGDHDSPALGRLVEELFLRRPSGRQPARR